MAKIYETKEDFQKDVLTNQAREMRLEESKQDRSGLSSIALSAFAQLYHERKPETRGWLATVGNVLGIVGLINVIRAWGTGNKAHNLEMMRDRMGPQTVVLPSDIIETPEKDCGCKKKRFAEALAPISLMEQAAKSESPPSRG